MSVHTPHALESIVSSLTTDSNRDEVLSELVEAIKEVTNQNRELQEEVEQLRDEVDEVRDEREQLRDEVDEVRDEREQLRDKIDELRDEREQLRDEIDELRDDADDRDARLDALSTGLATAHDAIEAIQEKLGSHEPQPAEESASESEPDALQRDELTPVERLATDGDVEEVTTSASVERAVTIFENIESWGTKVPKGYTIRPEDNPLALLEAARDEDLSWRQWYRAAQTLEQLSKGAVTFFDSDRHGKMICLHEQSEVYERLTSDALSPSSVGGTA